MTTRTVPAAPSPASGEKSEYTACLIIIGNEILSGRTRDANLGHLALKLNEWGVRMREARVIPDVEATIVETVNECRARFDYVFTTGGIGPTHDDITAACVAKAFGVGLVVHQDSFDRMAERYPDGQFNTARQKMCFIPEGSVAIENSVSIAPGFQMGNVFVLAGVPSIMQAMLATLKNRLVGGRPVEARTISVFLGEGAVASDLAAIQDDYPEVDIGSYPFYRDGRFGTSLVLRSDDVDRLEAATARVEAMVRALGAEPHFEEA